jgi:glycine/D-amino acid oxidase-like deaminating enzyme
MELWRQQTLVPVTWCGALVCRNGVPPIHPPEYPQRNVSKAELQELEPGLTPGREWSYYPTEGLLEPVQAAELMIAEARRLGCRTEFEVNALAIELDSHGPNGEPVALRTEVGTFYADCVVLAAGNFVPDLLATAGTAVKIPTAEKPGLLVHTEPLPPGTINTIVVSPPDGVHMLQRPNGSVVLGGSICDEPDIDVEAVSEETLRRGALLIPALRKAKIKECSVGYRPFPADGYPVVGFVPGTKGQIYVAMSHSGITLASLWGALASSEIKAQSVNLGRAEPLSDTIPALLRDYRPGRAMNTSVVMDSGLPKSTDPKS